MILKCLTMHTLEFKYFNQKNSYNPQKEPYYHIRAKYLANNTTEENQEIKGEKREGYRKHTERREKNDSV